jgi:glutaredoxin domain-containing cysteine-rich protein 1
VLYTTTLRALRDTFEACNAARAALHAHGVAFRERDLSMDRGFRAELRALLPLPLPLTLPRLFVRGRHVGGAEEVLRMDEEGALGPLLHGLPRARPGGRCCDGCGGMRFLPCFDCSGSRKVVVAAAAGAVVKGRGERGVLMRCGECNENGLVLCPICS